MPGDYVCHTRRLGVEIIELYLDMMDFLV